jgi:hypothetical protein
MPEKNVGHCFVVEAFAVWKIIMLTPKYST